MSSKQPRLLIAGGYGAVGSHLARYLRQLSPDVELVLAGRNPEKGEPLAKELGKAATAYLDVEKPESLESLGTFDLFAAVLSDPAETLLQAALAQGGAHIGITKLADDIAPVTFAALASSPQRPIVLLSHWMAGVMTLAAQQAARAFDRIESVELTALFDARDPIGTMSAAEVGHFPTRALLRERGQWRWVEGKQRVRQLRLADGSLAEALPLGVLDVPSLATLTGAPNVRFDLLEGKSLGTQAGGPASHELYIDIEGRLLSGEHGKRRTLVSDPRGAMHMTALGLLVAIERVLALDGRPLPAGGLHLPETLVPAEAALDRFRAFGLRITESEGVSPPSADRGAA